MGGGRVTARRSTGSCFGSGSHPIAGSTDAVRKTVYDRHRRWSADGRCGQDCADRPGRRWRVRAASTGPKRGRESMWPKAPRHVADGRGSPGCGGAIEVFGALCDQGVRWERTPLHEDDQCGGGDVRPVQAGVPVRQSWSWRGRCRGNGGSSGRSTADVRRPTATVCRQVDLRGQSAVGPSEGMVGWFAGRGPF